MDALERHKGRVSELTRWKAIGIATCAGHRIHQILLSPGQVGEALSASEFTHSSHKSEPATFNSADGSCPGSKVKTA